uniref:Uncharacterized protein n=1 Tax=Arundo donax TaxID=35708 RepID=A0A0A9F6Z8_ARUDO
MVHLCSQKKGVDIRCSAWKSA